MATVQCPMTENQVQDAFLAAPPLIAQQILDLSIKHPNWLRDLFEVEEWPRGNGTIMEQLIFRGAMPQIERGFGKWKKQNNNSGCEPCEGPDCSYNWTDLGGNGFERKLTELMSREFRSPAYCIKEIQTTANFKEVFAKIVENLYSQIDFFKEMNIGQNFLTGLAKKYVVASAGAQPNTQNPYVYRNIGTARLSTLNIEMLEFFYEYMRRQPDAIPYDVVNGSPVFAIEASHQLLGRLYRDDPNLRQDVRFSGLANDMLMKYNFMSTIRGMFIAAPLLYPRRFNIVDGEPVEVLPFVNNVPMEVGSFTGFNAAYEAATHEEVLIHGKFPFKVFYMPTETTLGANSSFGPEFGWFNSWMWVNPMTVQDPFRRLGYFATSAQIGLSAQFSDAIYGILVERPSVTLMGVWLPPAECPPDAPTCDNDIPAVDCPCPLILTSMADPITPGQVILTLAAPLDPLPTPGATIQFGIDTGGYIVGTVVDVADSGLAVVVTFPTGTNLGICDHFTTLFCDNTLACSSAVLTYSIDASNNLSLVLSENIKAVTASDGVTLTLGNGDQLDADIVSADMSNNLYVVNPSGTFVDNVGGIVSICVPTATDATCPGCEDPIITQCS